MILITESKQFLKEDRTLYNTHLFLAPPAADLPTHFILTPQYLIGMEVHVYDDLVIAKRAFFETFEACRLDVAALKNTLV